MIYLLRLLFWTEWGKGAQIERCGMNGDSETRQILVSNNINWPNGLTIDYQTERLWWVDAKMARIESMNFDGTDRITQINGTNGELGHPFSLAVFGQSIFWTDWGQKLIYRTTKKDSSRRITVVKRLQNFSPMDIKIVHPHQQLKGITLFILMTFNVFIKSPAKYYISDIMMIKSCFFCRIKSLWLKQWPMQSSLSVVPKPGSTIFLFLSHWFEIMERQKNLYNRRYNITVPTLM